MLAKSSLEQVEAARDPALARSRSAADRQTADLFKHVADECSAELADLLLSVATRTVLRESREVVRRARELLNQAVNR